ncbi:MAG: hypothetical protein A2Z86_09555 [Candidatus Glassbacteria bacterium GWA2_58_10]|uniref:PEGA domain-containing protein n=1 Tax=Candidatus Glassbacteria bacterium GWA2_58_10 TaxID=1817865 RepID=A0A1F5YBV8_9BACT|nr:MAG: hypothetical protein A2Z86_09555 [Candidatus Glassbacteria bacterium GWA2_58_10]
MKGKAFYGAAVCLIAVLTSLFSGCALMMKGGKSQSLSIKSTPPGAQVYLDGNLSGDTPCALKSALKKDHVLEFRKEGYEKQIVLVANKLGAGWAALDLLFGALLFPLGIMAVANPEDKVAGLMLLAVSVLPVSVDTATGAWNHLERRELEVTLKKEQ